MAAIRGLLEDIGIEPDPTYGPIPVNPKLGRYVVRGRATPDARKKAQQIRGVRFFAEAWVKPISR